MGLGQLFEIKPRCCRGSLLRDELGLRQFETQNDLTRSFPRVPAGTLGRLGSPNLTQAGRYFRGNLWPSAIGRKVMKIVHKPVALAWRQRASSALRARAAATLPPAFMNNYHDFCPTRARRGMPWHLEMQRRLPPRIIGWLGEPSLLWRTSALPRVGGELGRAAAAGFEFFA
jgi:hypothetical protein